MTTTFEDRLLSELQREVRLAAAEERQHQHQHGPAGRRLFTPARAGIGLATAAAAGAALVVLPGGASSPAYAVERTGVDGLRVTIADWPHGEAEVREFAALMEEHGVATIYNPPGGYRCQPLPDGAVPPPGDLPEPPPGEGRLDSSSFISPAGGATVIGPEVAQAQAPDGAPENGGGGERGHHSVGDAAGDAPEDYVYRLHAGDSVILTEVEAAATITFVEGACAPVSGGGTHD